MELQSVCMQYGYKLPGRVHLKTLFWNEKAELQIADGRETQFAAVVPGTDLQNICS